jgi:hypothetical protein
MQLFTKSYWIKTRRNNLIAARECRQALTNPAGFWKYAPDDARVAKAVAVWVEKARQCHAIAMERRPVIENAVVINYGTAQHGSFYARRA